MPPHDPHVWLTVQLHILVIRMRADAESAANGTRAATLCQIADYLDRLLAGEEGIY